MQVEGNWRAAANLNLLLGREHPPARLEKALLNPQKRSADTSGLVVVEARNTANFRSSSYCGFQDKTAPAIRRNVIEYYREILHRVPIWRGLVKTSLEPTAGDAAVKAEPQDDDGGADGVTPSAGGAPCVSFGPLFRAVGILTQVHDPSAASLSLQQTPWEFHVVQDVDDDECYLPALHAMTQTDCTPSSSFVLFQDASHTRFSGSTAGRQECATNGVSAAAAGTSTMPGAREETAAEAEEEAAARDGTRISLYTRQVSRFTGLYPGMAVGVIGEPFQRSARGVLTGVLVREFVLPSRPVLPWRVDRPLPSLSSASNSRMADPDGGGSAAVRIHFCSGPFPRRDVSGLLRTVTSQALRRGADVLIIGGPFIPPFISEFERGLLPSLGATFNEMMESFVDTLEETLTNYYATRQLLPHIKVLLVSHRGDVTQIPVLPTTMYAIADTDDILVRSNPCRLSVNGVHVSVCNEDVVGDMRERMVERWPTPEGSLRRVVEALVNGRLYTPLYRFPVTTADLKHLPHLRMHYMPPANELLEMSRAGAALGSNGASKGEHSSGINGVSLTTGGSGINPSRVWESVLDVAGGGSTTVADSPKQELKRIKLEKSVGDAEDGDATPGPAVSVTASPLTTSPQTEYLPHIMFLPSTRPQFAFVTHQSEEVDGPDLDSTDRASGILVANQEVWSTRSSPKFELRVMEVTIPNTDLVLRRGATPANGVTCGVLHIYSA
ncbi:hypothetical protein JKF63_02534 [Porcisia hertigi]|uniref:DNA polymerase alpha subunit B n=1 Tax=Porcisia hertigi TaxID=2761500 RepID=A0A836I9N9_9TRYP|nr:hypothetical protein JKF63_02534 [Porcisia hertigi]